MQNKSQYQQDKKIALVHDYLLCFGGAERVLKALSEMFPEAPIYVISYDKKITEKYFPNAKIHASFIQKAPYFWKKPKYLLPLLPIAAESFDLSQYDLVVSSSSAFAKGVITKPKTIHICYCHSPMRFAWDYAHEYNNKLRGVFGAMAKIFLHYIRIWDRHCETRVDYFIANSEHTRERIKKFYQRDAIVIYPPIQLIGGLDSSREKTGPSSAPPSFLIVSQLRHYKRIDVAIEAFNKLELPLLIIGEGPERGKLETAAKSNIQFLGWQDDKVLARYYSQCKAFIFPGEEDFGITAVEAMSFGKPVLAYRKGGVAETVIEGVTGEFFDDLDPAVLADGVRRILENYPSYNPEVIKNRAAEFGEERFKTKIKEFLEKTILENIN